MTNDLRMFSALKRFLPQQRRADDIARAFARCFQTPDGQIVLEHLHQHVLFRMTDPQQSPALLRAHDGQRQLVLWLCQMVAKGHAL